MELTNEQKEWIQTAYEECLYHWCHPWGDEPPSRMGCTDEEYHAAAKQYYYDALSDPTELKDDWEYTWEETEKDFKDEFGTEIPREVHMPIFMKCLKEHLIN